MVMRYSPSAGKLCLKPMPPRVPKGRGTSGFELAAMVYFVLATLGLGLPIAAFATCRAAVMYWLRNAGDTVNAAAMLSKPSSWPSCGRTSAAFNSTPTSAFTDAVYSMRFRRWS